LEVDPRTVSANGQTENDHALSKVLSATKRLSFSLIIPPPISRRPCDTDQNMAQSPVKTRLRESLERAKAQKGPSVGQWLEFPGYTLAKTVASLGEDVS
jgi:hypothetical protein